jgi:hypothetical protein
MRISRRIGVRWAILALTIFCVAGILVGLYVRSHLRRPIPPLVEGTDNKSEFYWPIFHTFTPTQKAHVLDGDFLIVKSVDRLPDGLKAAFCRLAGLREFNMANPGEKYQEADVIVEPGLPFQRLLFAGISSDKYFLHYETGGIGHSYHVAVFSVDSERNVKFLWGGPGKLAKDLNQLRATVAAGDYKDDQAYSW